MRINGSDLISRPTQISARLLIISSGAAIIVARNDLDPTKWGLLGEQVTSRLYAEVILVTIVFLSLSLCVHWSADYYSYRNWFKTNEINIGTLGGISSPKPTEPPVAALARRLDFIEREFSKLDNAHEVLKLAIDEEFPKLENKEYYLSAVDAHRKASETVAGALKSVKRNVDGANLILDQIEAKFQGTDVYARFLVFVWYLAIPLFAAFGALFLTICHYTGEGVVST